MPDLPFRIVVTDSGTAVVQRFAAQARKLGGVGRTVGRTLSRGFSLAQGAIGGAVSRVFNLRNALLGLGVGLAIRRIVNTFGEFEKQMNTVRVLTNATTTEFEALTEQAKQLGLTTKFSAGQAAEGMTFLAKAGFEANEVLAALPDTLTLAAAANIDLGQAANIVTNILTGLQIPIEDLGQATDVLVQAFTSANTDLTQLGQAFKFAGPIATTAGLEFEEVATVLAFLGDAGIAAGMAGRTLRQAIVQLLKPSREGQMVLDELGVTVKTAGGNLRPFSQILEDLQPIANNSSKLLAVFGTRAALMSTVLQRGTEEFRKFGDMLRASGGRAAEVAAEQLKGLAGAIILMRSAIDGAVLAIGDELAPALINAANGMALLGRNTGIAIQAISEASEAAGEASRNAFLGFIPASETIIRAIARVNKSWLELGIVVRLVQRTFFNLGVLVLENVFLPIQKGVGFVAKVFVAAFTTIRNFLKDTFAFALGLLADGIQRLGTLAKQLPADLFPDLGDQLLNLSREMSNAAIESERTGRGLEALQATERKVARDTAFLEGNVDKLRNALDENAQEIEKTIIEIAKLDQQTGFAINRSRQLTEALNKQTQATKDVSAATRQATKDAKEAAQAFKSEIGAILAFGIDPRDTGFETIRMQLATIGPNAVKAGQDLEAAFEKARTASEAIGPEQFAVFEQQTDVLLELIRIFELLPESARASFDGQVAAIIKGTEEGSAVLRRGIQSDLQLRLQANATTLNATASLFGALANIAETSGRKGFETSKAFRIAETIIAGLAGSIQVFASPGITDPFVKFALSAAILANTFATVQRIRSTQPGGGGGGGGGGISAGGGGGGGGAPPGLVVPAEAAEQDRGPRITISVAGFIGSEAELASQLSNVIREAQGDDVDFGLEVSR